MQKFTLLLCGVVTALNIQAADTLVPFGNGTWVHDYTMDTKGAVSNTQAGRFANFLKAYNEGATAGHQITEIFASVGALEIHPPPAGEAFVPNSFYIDYYPQRILHVSLNNWRSWEEQLDSGLYSVHAYSHLTSTGKKSGKHVLNLVQINGAAGTKTIHGLQFLNGLSQADAAHFADFVAGELCSDDTIDGVQFDIEPFSFVGSGSITSGPGQKYFFAEIAKDFAGQFQDPKNDPLNCVDGAHKQGRIFSVFTSASAIQEDPDDIAKVFTQYGNGYVIDSVYDLSGQPAGTPNPPNAYQTQAQQETSQMMSICDRYKIPYQFGIPASASAHEFEKMGTTSTGYNQLDYVQAAINVINASGARQDPLFKGIDLWGWNTHLVVDNPAGGVAPVYPSNPAEDQNKAVLKYLQTNL